MAKLTSTAKAAAAEASAAATAPQMQAGSWTAAAWTLAGFVVLAFLIQGLALLWNRKLAKRSPNAWDDLLSSLFQRYGGLWVAFMGLAAAAKVAPIPLQWGGMAVRAMQVALLLTATLALAGLAAALTAGSAQKAGLSASGTSLSRTLARGVVVILGGLMILSQIGISVAPLLTALGVGSLAVALALQDTLANLFAGFYVIASRQVHVGDYVRLDTGQEGYVDDISWRACRLKDLAGYYVMIPNQKLAQSIVTNYSRPQPEIALVVNLGVAYSSDLPKVERITVEVAKEALQKTRGAVPDFEPFIRYNDFGEGAIKLSVILKIKAFVDRFLLTHEFMKMLHARYRAEGIELPAPRMDVRMVETPRM